MARVEPWAAWQTEDWRSAIAEYTHLYTNETFSRFDPDAAMQAAELSAVSAKVGAILTPEDVALPNLRFTRSCSSTRAFRSGHRLYWPLRGSSPALHSRQSRTGAPTRSEQGADLSLAWWSRSERTRLIIGRFLRNGAAAVARSKNEFNLLFARTVRRLWRFASSSLQASPCFRPRSLLAEARRVGIASFAALSGSVGRQSTAAGEA
jgi:hypothetical protein